MNRYTRNLCLMLEDALNQAYRLNGSVRKKKKLQEKKTEKLIYFISRTRHYAPFINVIAKVSSDLVCSLF